MRGQSVYNEPVGYKNKEERNKRKESGKPHPQSCQDLVKNSIRESNSKGTEFKSKIFP